jgi:hypothetical protein
MRSARRRTAGIDPTRNAAFLTGLFFLFLAVSAKADTCPGSNTCPIIQSVIVQGPNAVELIWIEPEEKPSTGYLVTSIPGAPNQPAPFSTGNPNDPADHTIYYLSAGTYYKFRICADQSCVTTPQAWRTQDAQGEAGTPTPMIIPGPATTTSINISWNGFVNYDMYHVQLDDTPPQTAVPGGVTGSYTFQHLNPGIGYKVEVQGCWTGGSYSVCSKWATTVLSTAPTPLPPPRPPQNLTATSSNCCEVDLSWTNTPGWTRVLVSRAPDWTISNSRAFNAEDTAFSDFWVVPGQTYLYKVCLQYDESTTDCATVTGVSRSGAPPPPVQPSDCQLAFTCPQPVYAPPNYTLTCPVPSDFYQQSSLTGRMTYLSTDTKLSGTSTENGDPTLRACLPGSSYCSQYSVYKSQHDWCAPPDPSPPPDGPPGGCGGQKGPCGKCPGGTCQ